MMRSILLLAVAAPALLSGCGVMNAPMGTVSREAAVASQNWRSVATVQDRERIRGWYDAWQAGLASARSGGHSAAVAAEGALLDPVAALPNAHLPPGDYACRVIKLGAARPGNLGFVAYPAFRCRVAAEQDIFSFTKLTGSQRPVGLIFADNDRRKIFLGTLMLGDEANALDYGTDPQRDMAGIVERIGPNRWRMVFPRPAYESIVDVMELVPAN
jgi:hypothetical protein